MRYLFLILSILTPCLFLSSCLGSKIYVVSNYDDIQKTPLHAKGVYGRCLSDEDILYLGRLKNIEDIDLCLNSHKELNLTDNGWENLTKVASKLPKLRKISLCKSNLITDKSLYWISKIKQLNYVYISDCPKVTNEGFNYLSNNTHIKGISIEFSENVNNTTLRYLRKMPNLNILYLDGSNLDTNSMFSISDLKLKELIFTAEKSPNFDDASLKELSKSKTIEKLDIRINGNITSDGIKSLINMERLKKLDVAGCTPKLIDKQLFKEFYTSLPNCETIFREGESIFYHYEPSGDKVTVYK